MMTEVRRHNQHRRRMKRCTVGRRLAAMIQYKIKSQVSPREESSTQNGFGLQNKIPNSGTRQNDKRSVLRPARSTWSALRRRRGDTHSHSKVPASRQVANNHHLYCLYTPPTTPAKTYCLHLPRHGRARLSSGALRFSSNARACKFSSNSCSAGKVDSRAALGSTQATSPRLAPMVASTESCPVSGKRAQSFRNAGSHSSPHRKLSLQKRTRVD